MNWVKGCEVIDQTRCKWANVPYSSSERAMTTGLTGERNKGKLRQWTSSRVMRRRYNGGLKERVVCEERRVVEKTERERERLEWGMQRRAGGGIC